MVKLLFGCALLVVLPVVVSAVAMEMVTVADPGNAPDPLNTNQVSNIGSVSYVYQIGKYEVDNAQYAEFLNSVAATDTYGLYNSVMASDVLGGINRLGSSGSYTYEVKPGYEFMPVNYVSFYDAARFANWMANGQPSGPQGVGTTETGSYTLTGASIISARQTNATWVIPNENEWYKAAYYQPSGAGGPTDEYWLYPSQSDLIPNSRAENSFDPNSGNFYRNESPYGDGINDGYAKLQTTTYYAGTNYLTESGSYAAAASFYGTYDQAGNVMEWDETIVSGTSRGLRGGDWNNSESYLRSSNRHSLLAASHSPDIGFRVVLLIPEPSCFVTMLFALAGFCVRVLRRRRC